MLRIFIWSSWLKFTLKASLGIQTRGATANFFFPYFKYSSATSKITFLLFPLPILLLVFGVTQV